jgi:membrane fusion protein (multidrug efflux system)
MHYSRRRKRVILGFLTLLIVSAFIIIASARFSSNTRDQERYKQERAAMKPPMPNVVVIESATRPQVRRYAAQLRPWMEANVPSEVSGRVTEVLVEGGTPVEAGQPLVKLDDRLATIAVDRARANHEESQRLLEEAKRLIQTRAISNTQYAAQAAQERITKAALDESLELLARHTIRSPFDGVVNGRFVDVGDAVNSNQPVAEVVDLSRLRVELFVSEHDLMAFPVDRKLELLVPAIPTAVFAPRVNFVSKSADPETRLFRVEAILENTDDLPGGLQGVVSNEVEVFKGLPMVPAMAVRFVGRESLVWKEDENGNAAQTGIIVGPELDGFYPVFQGLQGGDRIHVR